MSGDSGSWFVVSCFVSIRFLHWWSQLMIFCSSTGWNQRPAFATRSLKIVMACYSILSWLGRTHRRTAVRASLPVPVTGEESGSTDPTRRSLSSVRAFDLAIASTECSECQGYCTCTIIYKSQDSGRLVKWMCLFYLGVLVWDDATVVLLKLWSGDSSNAMFNASSGFVLVAVNTNTLKCHIFAEPEFLKHR